MPTFRLRSWAEETLFACRDYTVTADTVEEAVDLLRGAQEKADNTLEPVRFSAIGVEEGMIRGVVPLDPSEVCGAEYGITLLNEKGQRLADMTEATPTGCVRLEPTQA